MLRKAGIPLKERMAFLRHKVATLTGQVYEDDNQVDASRPADAAAQRRVVEALSLALQLGVVPVELKGADLETAVAAYARQTAATHVLVGRSLRGWLSRRGVARAARPVAAGAAGSGCGSVRG